MYNLSGTASVLYDFVSHAENALQTLRRATTAQKQELLFKAWDTDGDGFVEVADISKGLQGMRPNSEEIHLEFIAEAALKALPSLDSADPAMQR